MHIKNTPIDPKGNAIPFKAANAKVHPVMNDEIKMDAVDCAKNHDVGSFKHVDHHEVHRDESDTTDNVNAPTMSSSEDANNEKEKTGDANVNKARPMRRLSSKEQNQYLPAHLRRPSAASSIPHLMGVRLSFAGIDSELPFSSLDSSLGASPSSGEVNAEQGAPLPWNMSPCSLQANATPTPQEQGMFGFNDDEAPSNSNTASPVSGSNRYNSALTQHTPPYDLGKAIVATSFSPPQKLSQLSISGRRPQHDIPDQLPHLDSSSGSSCKKNEGANSPLIVTNQLIKKSEPIPCHEKQRPKQQPVHLYSAINSLERYNEGSFDNNKLYAKAFSKRDNAFPGIPSEIKPLKSSRSHDSASASTHTLDSNLHFGAASSQDTTTTNDRGEKSRHTNLESSLKKTIRSRSSGDVSDGNTVEESTRRDKSDNRVTIVEGDRPRRRRRRERKEKKVGVFRPTGDAYTPRMGKGPIKYKPAQERESVDKMSSTMGTIQRPNFRDALRRVAIIIHQHIVKIEHRFQTGIRGEDDTGLFKSSMRDTFSEERFATPRYKCSMVRVPMACPGVVYSMRKIRVDYRTPTTDEIYDFAHQLFKKVQLSSECSIVCLIYVEKLMEVAKVPLVARTWRPIFMCGLLLASKVWQDLSSWNIEFASVYPQFSIEAINRLEVQFLKSIKWDLYISSTLYAKYYFALRSLLEKSGFRDRYNQMVGGIGGIAASEAIKVSKRSEAVKEEAIMQLSRSM